MSNYWIYQMERYKPINKSPIGAIAIAFSMGILSGMLLAFRLLGI